MWWKVSLQAGRLEGCFSAVAAAAGGGAGPGYLLEALLVPGGAIHAVGGDLPPIGDVLANLVPVAVPLPPLAIWLRCREAHFVLLKGHNRKRGSDHFSVYMHTQTCAHTPC